MCSTISNVSIKVLIVHNETVVFLNKVVQKYQILLINMNNKN